jgi:hypothetical protein
LPARQKITWGEHQDKIYEWLFWDNEIDRRFRFGKYELTREALDKASEDYKNKVPETNTDNELYLAARVALLAGENKEKLGIEKSEKGCIAVKKGDGQIILKMNVPEERTNYIHSLLEEVSASIHTYLSPGKERIDVLKFYC